MGHHWTDDEKRDIEDLMERRLWRVRERHWQEVAALKAEIVRLRNQHSPRWWHRLRGWFRWRTV